MRIFEELWMPDLQIAMRDPKVDRIRATRRFGAFAVLTLRAIEKIRAERMTTSEAQPSCYPAWTRARQFRAPQIHLVQKYIISN